MKEKLVIAFYWLAIIVLGLGFFSEALSTIQLRPLAALVNFVNFFGEILLTLVTLRLLCEIAVAIFRINNNLSPDGGKSETADIDPLGVARKAAEATALKAREVTKTAGEKASAANKAPISKAPKKTTPKKVAPKKTPEKKAVKKAAAAPVKTKAATRKAPVNQKATVKTKTATKTLPRDAEGRVLNKDGSLRKKPTPKKT